MPTFRCRTTVPTVSEWREVNGVDPNDAAQEYHARFDGNVPSLRYRIEDDGGKVSYALFALVEVEGHGSVVSRLFSHGIFRVGKVRNSLTLRDIAQHLGYEHDPGTLISSEGWEGEVSLEQAIKEKGWP